MTISLKHKTISGMLWSGVQRFGTMLILLIVNIILARLLFPKDFGYIGMLSLFIVLAETFVDGGLGAALIQKQNPSDMDYSTIFYWNFGFSILIYFLLFLSAPLIADFYSMPLLTKILRVQGLILIINALQIVHSNRVRKALNFKRYATINISAVFLGGCIAIAFAFNGFGVWSLVIQYIAISIFITLFHWILSDWRPSFKFSFKSLKELFSYGIFMMLCTFLQTFLDNFRMLIIGKVFSIVDLGLYTQAKKMEEVPSRALNNVVNQVAFPVFSEIQHQKEKTHNALKKSLKSLCFLNFPMMILLIVIAEPLFHVLLTDKWSEAVPYFQILCLAGLPLSMSSVNYNVIAALGKSKELFYWNIIKVIIAFILLFIGLQFGMLGVLYSYVLSTFITYVINAYLTQKYLGYQILVQLRNIFSILLLACLVGVICWAIKMIYCENSILFLLFITSTYVALFLLLSRLFRVDAFFIYWDVLRKYKK